MGERPRILIIEDDFENQQRIAEEVEDMGGSVVKCISSREEALVYIESLSELDIDLVTLDANLARNRFDGQDGRDILAAIRAKSPNTPVIGLSSEQTEGVNDYLKKSEYHKLPDTIKRLTNKS